MCKNQMFKSNMSPLPIKLAKITVILIFFCFAECAAGSCLSYGHACWGAHGKRSNTLESTPTQQQNRNMINPKWFLSRLVQGPLDLRLPTMERERQLFNNEIAEINAESEQLKGDDYKDDLKSGQDLIAEDDNVLLDEIYSHPTNTKLKIAKLFDNRSSRMF